VNAGATNLTNTKDVRMILVTGTSGALGGLILDRLSATDGPPVVAGTRTGDGTTARRIDFDDPATLADGFAGVDVLVFVSAGYADDDVVLARHGAVVDAAASAGVRHVIYTSLGASGESLTVALAHRWTEARLGAAPFASTILRNGLYAEVPAAFAAAGVGQAAATGVFSAAMGAGRMSVVAREDLADVAGRVAVEVQHDLDAGAPNRHAGRTYELEGLTAVGGEDIAELMTATLGRPVQYRTVSLSDTRAVLQGVPPYELTHTLSLLSNINAGFLHAKDSDLTSLLPRPPRPVRDLITKAVLDHAPA
jgi:uncharacterized protein YbjT (DUF2867 family)